MSVVKEVPGKPVLAFPESQGNLILEQKQLKETAVLINYGKILLPENNKTST